MSPNPTRPDGPEDPSEHDMHETRDTHDALDTLDELELDAGDDDLGSKLRALLDPTRDLPDRTSIDVERRLRGRSVLATGFELLGLGAMTMRTLLSDEPAPADQVSERDRHERS